MIKRLMRAIGSVAAGAALVAVAVSPAPADVILDFENPTLDGGSITYDGAGGALIGTDIIFQSVVGVGGTPLNNGVTLFCYPVNCLLDFTSGANTSEGPDSWTFAGGGTFTIIGGLNTAADGSGVQVVAAGSVLVSGSFVGDVTVDCPLCGLGVELLLAAGAGTDTKAEELAAFYGLTNPFVYASTAITASGAVIGADGSISAEVNEADVTNFAIVIPEPASLLLVGSGLLTAWFVRRRKR